MDKRINIGLIGTGGRGQGLLELVFLHHKEVDFPIVCDIYEDRCVKAADLIEKSGRKRPEMTTDYKEILKREDIDGVIICTSWEHHIDLCIAAMEAGKYVGCEVGGAYSIRECWKLVEAYEKTKVPVMMLENCIYGRDEMMVENMVRQGVMGTIVHCEGGYKHDLRDEIAFGNENRHYRLSNYIHRNTENYPTHELGPIARILNINRGNRMMILSSAASRAEGLSAFVKEKKADDKQLLEVDFRQGDVVNTMITCAGGETILLTLDTTLPRYYSRGFTVQGTKGMYCEENQSLFLEDEAHVEDHFEWKKHWGNVEEYREKYEHPVWKKYQEEGIKEGHGGMDWLVFCDFIDCVKNKTDAAIDVYDMASWMCISVLAEESIAMGGQPVVIPDFTNGAWMNRKNIK
ncbi:MAG: Gfo/Idh/MocA family oxidoreductase [Clostridia bacterium]|nr:Gfo/Idh/MocA family oxidoreductase [Clostridia bacterium]NCC42430.1 Gfo/Idh/MocA family oxidoreductase [Clostridia bacterium]